jgi:hypothetical protein
MTTPTPLTPAVTDSDIHYCANHPDRETSLRCNRCGKYICVKCARRTPIGYRCKDCVTQQQQIFETALWYDYVIAGVLCFALSAIAGALVSFLGFFVIILAPVVGGVLAQVVTFAVRKRRSKYLPWVAAGAAALGGLAICSFSAFPLVFALLGGGLGGRGLLGLLSALWPLIYTALCTSTLFYSLRGIRIN